jgi:hypothetical protein
LDEPPSTAAALRGQLATRYQLEPPVGIFAAVAPIVLDALAHRGSPDGDRP